jgi:hypothetical protein
MSVEPLPRPWRKYLRFSVRGLIVLVLVIGVGLAWLVRSAHIQRDAVASIENTRGQVAYHWDSTNGQQILRGKPWAPRWLVDLIGVDFFGHVTSVRLARLETDGVLKHVGRLTQLERLTISVRAISDAELAPLQALNNLSFLDLSKLSHLQLFATQASCAGVQELKQAVPGLVIVR